jgi:hypothetical protein
MPGLQSFFKGAVPVNTPRFGLPNKRMAARPFSKASNRGKSNIVRRIVGLPKFRTYVGRAVAGTQQYNRWRQG